MRVALRGGSVNATQFPPFFVDRSLGRAIVANALRAEGLVVEVHDDHFPQNTTDVAWLAQVGAKGWVIITKDLSIRRRPLEVAALKACGAHAFFLGNGNLTGAQMARVFVSALPHIGALIDKAHAQVLGVVHLNGSVAVIT